MTGGGAENPSRAQALVVVDELARCGVAHAVVAPGSRSGALAAALDEDPRIATHVAIDERSAGFVAVGVARGGSAPAVVVTTSGTATANLLPAVVESDAADVPLLVLTADRPPELRGTGANQTIDQLKLYGDRVREFVEVGVAEDRPDAVASWRSTVCRLVAAARGVGGRPGPVHANLAFREPTVPASDDGRSRAAPFSRPLDGRGGRRPWTSVIVAPRWLPDADLTDLAGRIASTERGLVVVGDAPTAAPALAALGRRAGWPVIAEPTSGLRGHPGVLDEGALLAGHPSFLDGHRPDLVLRAGRLTLSRGLGRLLGPDVPQVLLDAHGRWLDAGRGASVLVAAEPQEVAASLSRLLAVDTDSEWAARWRSAAARARAVVDGVLDGLPAPSEPRTARDVVACLPDGSTLVVGSSLPIRDVDAYAVGRRRVRMLANRGASGIDGVTSTALGVALVASDDGLTTPSGPVVCLLGDLALLHDATALLLRAGADRIDLTLVVANNDGGGLFSLLPQAAYPQHFERVFGTPHGRDPAAFAALHGVAHERVASPGEVGTAVRAAVDAGGVRLVEVRTRRDETARLHRRLADAVAAAV